MKIIRDHRFEVYGTVHVYRANVVESATNWYVTLYRSGWAYPVVLNQKVSKRAVCTPENAALNAVYDYEHTL